MATKTITIDMEAYRRLKGAKKDGESFSQTIKRVVRPPVDVTAWFSKMRSNPMSREALEAVEKAIRARAVRSRRGR